MEDIKTQSLRQAQYDQYKRVANATSDQNSAAGETILEEAQRLIYGDRADAYGDTRTNFERMADLWAPILGARPTAEEVILCMIQLKVSREINKHSRDNIVDIAGYAGCMDKMERGL